MSFEIEFRQTVLAAVRKLDDEGKSPDAIMPVARNSIISSGSFSLSDYGPIFTEIMSLWYLKTDVMFDSDFEVPFYLSDKGEVVSFVEATSYKGTPVEYTILTLAVLPIEQVALLKGEIESKL